jgi:hypothetical protein
LIHSFFSVKLLWRLRTKLESNLGILKEIGSLVATSANSIVDTEIGLKLVSLLHFRFRVKQAQIELSRDHDRHRVVKDWIHHEQSTSVDLSLKVLIAGIFKSPCNEQFKTYCHVPSPETGTCSVD